MVRENLIAANKGEGTFCLHYSKEEGARMSPEIEVSFPGNLKVNAQVGEFIIPTDQPEKVGGDGSAPTPFNLFAASIVTCAGFFAAKFCRTRDIAIDGMKLTMSYDWDKEKKRYAKMTMQLTLPKSFPAKYQKPLLRALDQCLVLDHIHNPPEFETNIVSS